MVPHDETTPAYFDYSINNLSENIEQRFSLITGVFVNWILRILTKMVENFQSFWKQNSGKVIAWFYDCSRRFPYVTFFWRFFLSATANDLNSV